MKKIKTKTKKYPILRKEKRKTLTRNTGRGRLGIFRGMRETKRNGKERSKG